MRFYFDNSVVNFIQKEGLLGEFYRWMRTNGHVLVVSDYNWIEAGVSEIPENRTARIEVLTKLPVSQPMPLPLPSIVFRRGLGDPIARALPSVMHILEHTSIQDLKNAKAAEEDWMNKMVTEARPDFQKDVEAERRDDRLFVERLGRSSAILLRHYWQAKDIVSTLLKGYHEAVGRVYDTETDPKLYLLNRLPLLAYLAAITVVVHRRDIRREGYSSKKNAGSIDAYRRVTSSAARRVVWRSLSSSTKERYARDVEIVNSDAALRQDEFASGLTTWYVQ